jgi:Acetyltransferases, including N-acetylases of ribosomal proteins
VLTARLIGLRAVRREDVVAMHAQFDTDPGLHAVAAVSAWLPIAVERRLAEFDRGSRDPAEPKAVDFAVQRLEDPAGRAIGAATVWGIDEHQRIAHLGLTLFRDERGHGLGRDVLHAMCRYAFEVRDLHRVQLETLGSNVAMQRAAIAAGFAEEGRLRENSYVMGTREDDVIYGLLAAEWRSRT